MSRFRLKMNVGLNEVRYSQPLGCIDALKIAGAVRKATGTEPEIVPNTRTLQRTLAMQDAATSSVEAAQWGLCPPLMPNVPDVQAEGWQPLGWRRWVQKLWEWLVNSGGC